MYEARLSNLAARITIQTNNSSLSEDATARWVERMSDEVDALQSEIERNQNVEPAPRAAMLKTLADAREQLRVLAFDQT